MVVQIEGPALRFVVGVVHRHAVNRAAGRVCRNDPGKMRGLRIVGAIVIAGGGMRSSAAPRTNSARTIRNMNHLY